MTRILVAGLATIDFLFHVEAMPQRAQKYRATDALMTGGGGAANAAVAIARLGGAASLVAGIGEDRVGDMILADLGAEGVDTALVWRRAAGRSAFSSVLIDARGERRIVNFRGSGEDALPDPDCAPPVDAVLTDTRFPTLTRAALRLAKARGVPGIVDGEHPVDLADVAEASHIAFSAQGLMGLTESSDLPRALEAVAAQIGSWLCVTDGAGGVLSRSDGAVPAPPVEAVDTLGAGDVWHGAFALRLAEGADERTAMIFANAAASLKCTRSGGRVSYPVRAEAEAFQARGEPLAKMR